MLPTDKILQLLQNSGFKGPGGGPVVVQGPFFLLEDPTCITRSVADLVQFAWLAITIVTALMLVGWAIAIFRAGKIGGIANNLRNLVLIFGILAAALPIGNAIYGGDLFGAGCKQISVKIDDVQKILAAQNSKLKTASADGLDESFDIYDSGATYDSGAAQTQEYSSETDDSGASAPIGFTEINGTLYETDNSQQSPIEQMPASAVPTATATLSASPARGGSSSAAVSAVASGKTVIFTGADGVRRARTGDRAARNNNPGNMEYGPRARQLGAIGTDGRFAIFPDYETGRTAQQSLLKSGKYVNLTIADAVKTWAPAHENDVVAYQQSMYKWTGIPLNTRIADLNPTQLNALSDAMYRMEGNRVTETILN